MQAALVAPGKGILAADESGGTIGKRFASIGEHGLVFRSETLMHNPSPK